MDKALQPYQARVVEEKAQLDERMAKLAKFMEVTPDCDYMRLPYVERHDLCDQLDAMETYSEILGRRIARF